MTSRRRTSRRMRMNSAANLKDLVKADSDKYFRDHVAKKISKKQLSETLRRSGWTPRGKGSYNKSRGFYELLVDPPRDVRDLATRVVIMGSHYTRGDGQATVYVDNRKHGPVDAVFRLSGDPQKDLDQILSDLGEIMEGYVGYEKAR